MSAALRKALVDFTGCDLDSGVVDGLSTRLPIDNMDTVCIKDKVFCLTGVFIAGKRSVVEGLIQSAGGIITGGITKKLDFLVVGTLSSRDWKFSSYGRKSRKPLITGMSKALSYESSQRICCLAPYHERDDQNTRPIT
jgi:hypothetical protein